MQLKTFYLMFFSTLNIHLPSYLFCCEYLLNQVILKHFFLKRNVRPALIGHLCYFSTFFFYPLCSFQRCSYYQYMMHEILIERCNYISCQLFKKLNKNISLDSVPTPINFDNLINGSSLLEINY